MDEPAEPGDDLSRYPYLFNARDRQMQMGSADRLQRTPLFAIAGASCHLVDATIQERLHYLHSVDRHMLFATLTGRTRWSSGQIAGRSVTRKADAPGAISLTPAGWERRGEAGPGQFSCAHIELQPGLIADIAGSDHGTVDWAAPFNANEPKLFWMIMALTHEMRAPMPLPLLRETLLVSIARRVVKRFGRVPLRADDGWLAPGVLRRVIERMLASSQRSVALDELAGEANLTANAFVRAFRGTTGKTPVAFALDTRLEAAERHLRTGTRTVASIAELTGFSSASHLVAAMRQRRGYTPGQLR